MSYLNYRVLSLTLLCAITTIAQMASVSVEPIAPNMISLQTIYFRDIALFNGQPSYRPIEIIASGSIKGRVFIDADMRQETRGIDSKGIRGIGVILTSVESEKVLDYQTTNDEGTFVFSNLLQGNTQLSLIHQAFRANFESNSFN